MIAIFLYWNQGVYTLIPILLSQTPILSYIMLQESRRFTNDVTYASTYTILHMRLSVHDFPGSVRADMV
ncbi:hypothetical protein HZ326_22398 [Fusarium oxysporum f. sp. albedinis]|nr:hypothetical protein HZ326_22398 [Fusarium oxysporum f. sp. albedinis]